MTSRLERKHAVNRQLVRIDLSGIQHPSDIAEVLIDWLLDHNGIEPRTVSRIGSALTVEGAHRATTQEGDR